MWILSIPIILLLINIQGMQGYYDLPKETYFTSIYVGSAVLSMIVYWRTCLRNRKKDKFYILKDGNAGVVTSFALLSPLIIMLLNPVAWGDFNLEIMMIAFVPMLFAVMLDLVLFRLCDDEKEKKDDYYLVEKKSIKSLFVMTFISIAVLFGFYNFAEGFHQDQWERLLPVPAILFLLNTWVLLNSFKKMADEKGKEAHKKSYRNFWRGELFVLCMLAVGWFFVEPEIILTISLTAAALVIPTYIASVVYTVFSNQKNLYDELEEKRKYQEEVVNLLDKYVKPVETNEDKEVS